MVMKVLKVCIMLENKTKYLNNVAKIQWAVKVVNRYNKNYSIYNNLND